MDRDGHRGKVKVIEEHWQMVVKALRGCEVQLQRPEKEASVKSRIDHELDVVASMASLITDENRLYRSVSLQSQTISERMFRESL